MGYRRGRNHYQGHKEGGSAECNPETAAEERNLKWIHSSICNYKMSLLSELVDYQAHNDVLPGMLRGWKWWLFNKFYITLCFNNKEK